MLLFAHVGITAAVTKLIDTAFPVDAARSDNGVRQQISSAVNRFRDADGVIDYRMIIIGSMLPDIIDKPLALVMDNAVYFSGRGIFHSLLFNLLLLFGGIVFRKTWLRVLWFGSLMHLLLDSIWHAPVTLFWPFLGWFPPYDYDSWLGNIWEGLVTNPEVFIPEIAGFLVVAFIASRVIRGNGLMRLIKNGEIR
jgi:inner membrane protein